VPFHSLLQVRHIYIYSNLPRIEWEITISSMSGNVAHASWKHWLAVLGNWSNSHSLIRHGSCQGAPQKCSTNKARRIPPASLTGISLIPSETRFRPVREAGYEPMNRAQELKWRLVGMALDRSRGDSNPPNTNVRRMTNTTAQRSVTEKLDVEYVV
jgi:hypothetical protein